MDTWVAIVINVAIANDASMNRGAQIFHQVPAFIFFGYSEVELLDQVVILFFIKKIFKVIYFEIKYKWDRHRERGDRESQAGCALSAQRLTCGPNSQTVIMT